MEGADRRFEALEVRLLWLATATAMVCPRTRSLSPETGLRSSQMAEARAERRVTGFSRRLRGSRHMASVRAAFINIQSLGLALDERRSRPRN